ncbi:hypothetical protein AKJ61_04610 [candidate division MSBL1 archaeon SCGC-AAA259B11]|uniref:Protein AKJ61_04610 n=2 Tax=candidate division MSBL1 TaxID=215777 RepID=A0A133U317_9EURY|nr:hypothetical protein AKJ61_04610 [candidate division MSBL1 archaeon SCGC-AAA259B11]
MLDLEDGERAVRTARKAIETYLKEGMRPDLSDEVPEKFKEERGVFVTLNKNGNLRGCIGRPLPSQTLIDGLVDSAINAATGDPRFPSVDIEELEDITIEVSVLTVPEKIEVEDPKKYPEEIEVTRDGLIAKCRGREGLLLPQVPMDHDWSCEEFLSQTCVKAGLSPDAWLEGEVEFEKFSAQVFEESEPGGEVVEKSFT